MAPASNKRKRPDRQANEDDGANRPSPYKPEKSRLTRRASQDPGQADGIESGSPVEQRERPTNGTPPPAISNSRDGTETPAHAMDASSEGPTGTHTGSQSSTTGSRPKQPYSYQHLTDDVLSNWTESGSQGIINTTTQLDDLQLSDIFLELIRSALDGRLNSRQAGLTVREIISRRQAGDMDATELFLNTVMLLYEANYKGPQLRELLAATAIDQQKMREDLDLGAVISLGLVRPTFEKIRTRKTTNALYRQANFNLLREESEGYAKLITEFFNTAQEASSRGPVGPNMAEDAFQRVKALVGAFDLDVGRVLDITLDVSANLLVKAYPFFVKFYRASSWWPQNNLLDNNFKWDDYGFKALPSWALPGSGRFSQSDDEREKLDQLRESRDARFWDNVRQTGMDAYFHLGARQIVDFDSMAPSLQEEVPPEYDNKGAEVNANKRHRLNEDKVYMRETRCLPPPGNYDAAQLLGFKLRFYASEARDKDDRLPENLPWLAALLIKIGFISIRDLYPHLYPTDKEMPAERTRLEKEKAEKEAKERPGGGVNALLMAGALTDDTLPAPRRIEKDKSGGATPAQEKNDEPVENLKIPENQKILLLKALLLIGALPEALYILGRFPWLPEADYTIPPLLHRLARHMLSKVAESLHPLRSHEGLRQPAEQLAETVSRSDGALLFGPRPSKRVTRWLYGDEFSTKDGIDMRHYYGDWCGNIPVCQNLDDVFSLCDTFLGYLGAKIGQDVILYGTLLRLAQHSLGEDDSESNRARWLALMKRLLVPALSCSKHNPELARQVHELLSLFPTSTRYYLYAEWFTGKTSRQPDVRAAFDKNKAEVRDVLRRVSNDSVKKQSRALGKISLSSPGIVMMEMINQLESYSNMIPSLVDCTKYFSPLAWDVLNWALLNSLSGMGRDRMQADGMLTSPWLQALAQFVASLFAKYSHLSLSPILQYLASELRVGNSTDLELLEQVLAEMAGIRSDVEYNDSQVLSMAGGTTLRTHVLSQLSDSRHAKQAEAGRLMRALRGSGLITQFLVAIAQEQKIYPHHNASRFMPLKVLGNNLDKVSAVFQQYLEVLTTNLDARKFEQSVPDVSSLVGDYGLDPSTALTIHRTAIQSRALEFDAAKKNESDARKSATKRESSGANGDTLVKDAIAAVKEGGEQPSADTESAIEPDGGTPHNNETGTGDLQNSSSPWHPVREPIIHQLEAVVPELASRVSIPFFVTFWTLALGDILMPMENYQTEVTKLESQISEINSDRSDLSSAATKARDKRKKDLAETIEKLKREPKEHLKIYMAIRERIGGKGDGERTAEKSFWFPKTDVRAEIDAKHLGLLQECFLPRALMSSVDAQFSFEMLKFVHSTGTPGFSLMHLLNQLFKKKQIASLIFQCTATEAQHLGRFLCELLKYLKEWHKNQGKYESQALGDKKKLPGFAISLDEHGEPKMVLEYENFRRMLYNFHAHLNHDLQACFESDEYMHIRNGVIVLKAISPIFPNIKFIGQNMVKHVTKISTNDSRQDLKLAATSLLGPLRSREKDWVLPQAFRLNDPAKDGAKSGSRAPSARPETPQAGTNTPKLNASAPDFKPTSAPAVNGVARTGSAAEDGEIEDEKGALSKTKDVEMKDAPTTSMEKSVVDSGRPARPDSRASQQVPSKEASKPESKPTTPAPGNPRAFHAAGQQRADSTRVDSTRANSAQPGPTRAHHDLPSRPESGHFKPPPAAQTRAGGRYSNRDEQYGRLDRPDMRPGSREQSPGHRGRARTPPPGGPVGSRGYRDERPYDRQSDRPPYDSRTPRDDSYLHPRREASLQQRPSSDLRERSTPTNRASEVITHPDRMSHIQSVAVTSENLPARSSPSLATGSQQQQPEDQSQINPARLALINDGPGSRGREPRNERRERDERNAPGFGSRSEARPSGRGLPESGREPGSRQQQPDLAPTGPKRGRLQEESNYGRLNGPQDAPSGPRQPNGLPGRGRNFTAPVNARAVEPAAPSPTTSRPLESPTIPRGPSRQNTGPALQADRNNAPSSAPSTPAGEGPPVHPSRAAQFGQHQPSPIQTTFPAPNGPRNAGSPTTAPPSGPRGPARPGPPSGTPTGPSPANTIPPSGPATPAERQRREGQRQRASINATLQTNAPLGVQVKGASRNNSASFPTPPNRSGVPTVTSSMEPPQSRQSFDSRPGQADANFSHPNGRGDLFQGRGDERPDRSSRGRGSRDPSREPRTDSNEQAFRQPPAGPDDVRDRRGGPRDDRRSRDERMPRDAQARRDVQPRDGPQADRRGMPERQQRGPASDMAGGFAVPPLPTGPAPPQHEYASQRDGRGGGGGRSEGFRGGPLRREDERRDGSVPDGGRKRRHDDPQFDGNKRRRSGR
ncbi:Hypothetical predicted protein [Lecanosticta acicola]|uniref:THO complex subunit 2 n=1 Tax=Lecanosticta acicola TaxID=111012 RepID=A0AAI9EFS8_9PEZI|nr:Hypothetical predicted protein [Lecanosticta acicola]